MEMPLHALQTQELRIDRLENLMALMIENQTKTLHLLQHQSNRLDKLEALVESNTAILQEHGKRLENIEMRLVNIEMRLENIEMRLENVEKRLEAMEKLMVRVVDELISINKKMDRPRGMGFVPDHGGA